MCDRTTICICGGGNAAHVMAGLASAHPQRPEVRVLSLYQNEAEIWTKKMAEGDLIVVKHHPEGHVEEIKARPKIITNDASKAVTGADVIIFCVPAFAHQQYFEAVTPHLGHNTAIIGLPGKPGFEFQALHVLKDKAKGCVIWNYETLPWVCRLSEFGRKVDLLAIKETLTGSKVSTGRTQPKVDPVLLLQSLLGARPILKEAHNYLELLLMAMTFSHPPLMYGQWKDWDQVPLSQAPLFYQGLSEDTASVLSDVNDEVMRLARIISEAKPEVTTTDVEHAETWLKLNYRQTIGDPTSLYTAMRSNSAYNGLLHPMTEISPGQFIPDFQHRYLSEDVPFGLVVVKGVAQITGVDTPCIDQVLTWAQGHLGKNFMVGSELKGEDVKDTRAPQAFGLNSLEDLVAVM